ncbi:MAG TPA: DUF3999 domain-containing protein [Paraburkholderia sp.]|nr:DUF3999 domain-containing protein [Paraburkholderia sp.]
MKRVLKLAGSSLVVLSLAGFWAPLAAGATDSFARRFTFELDSGAPSSPSSSPSSYYAATLPAAVYVASQRDDLGDVRVFNDAGESVPYSIEAAREPSPARPVLRQAHWFPSASAASGRNGLPSGIRISPDGSLRAIAAPPSGEQHESDLVDIWRATRGTVTAVALLVHIRGDNFQGRVNIASSDDLRTWEPAGDAQLLKVMYNGGTLSQDRIPLDGVHGRYLRLQWLDGSPYIESLDLETLPASANSAQRAQAPREWREGLVAHAGPKAGEYFFETGGPFPVERLRLNLPQPNTVAPAIVYSRPGFSTPWRQVASGTLFRLHNGDVEQTNAPLELKPDTDRQWRVVFDARGGNLGSGALTVAAGWRPATLTFAAQGAAPFALAVGNAATIAAAVSSRDLLKDASAVPATARVLVSETGAEGLFSPLTASAPDARRGYLVGTALVLGSSSIGAVVWWLIRRRRARASDHGDAGGVTVAGLPGASATAHAAGAVGGTRDAADAADATGTSAVEAGGTGMADVAARPARKG